MMEEHLSQMRREEDALIIKVEVEYTTLLRKLAYPYSKYTTDDIDDMVGDVKLRICEKIRSHAYKNTGSFKCWVCTLSINYWISKYCRGRKGVNMVDFDLTDYYLNLQADSGALSPFERERKLSAIERLAKELPEPYRQLIDLRINKNQTYRAMSESLSKPLSTVALQVNAAYEMLEKDMNRLGYYDSSL